MDVFYVSLFGHRKIDNLYQLDDLLIPVLKEILQDKEYVSFFIGRNGEFDEYAASVVKRVRKELNKNNCDITLILPYKVAGIEYYEKYYDDIIIMDHTYPKAAITLKNRWMVERSDLVILYLERDCGGAYTAMKYAEKLNKKIIRLGS